MSCSLIACGSYGTPPFDVSLPTYVDRRSGQVRGFTCLRVLAGPHAVHSLDGPAQLVINISHVILASWLEEV